MLFKIREFETSSGRTCWFGEGGGGAVFSPLGPRDRERKTLGGKEEIFYRETIPTQDQEDAASSTQD